MLHFNKSLVCVCLLLALGLGELKAQSKESTGKSTGFGVIAGYSNVKISATPKNNKVTVSVSRSGFFIGSFLEYGFKQNIILCSEINFQKVQDLDILNLHSSIRYYIISNILIDVGVHYDVPFDEKVKPGLGVLVGLGYHIGDNLFLNMRYVPTFTNRIENDTNIDAAIDYLQLGISYRF